MSEKQSWQFGSWWPFLYQPPRLALAKAETYLILLSSISGRKSGLEFATAVDGTSEWVRPEDVERFKVEGEALLGKKTNPSDAEKGAHKTALSQLEVMRLKQVNSESQTEQLQVVRPGEASTAQLLEKMN